MVNCAVLSCKNDSRRQTKLKSNITFHRFPRNEELVRKWADALQRPDWEPSIRNFVCSAHFPEPSMYFSKNGLRKLMPDAVPQLLLDNFETQKRKKNKAKKPKIAEIFTADEKIKDFNVKSEFERRDCDIRNLKKRIINLTQLSKRRRLRCNALYAGLNRIRKKVTNVIATLKGLQMKISSNEELGKVLEGYGVVVQELFQGLGNQERSVTPELQEEQYFYAEVPSDTEDSPPPKRSITVLTTSYPPSPADTPCTPLWGGGAPSLEVCVKMEAGSPLASPTEPEPVFVDSNAVCRVCLLSAESVAPLDRDLRDLYEQLASTKLSEGCVPALCGACRGVLRGARGLAARVLRAETFHAQGAAEIKMAED